MGRAGNFSFRSRRRQSRLESLKFRKVWARFQDWDVQNWKRLRLQKWFVPIRRGLKIVLVTVYRKTETKKDDPSTRARTESIHFDSQKWIKKHKKNLIREVNHNLFWNFTWANHFIFDPDPFKMIRTNRNDSFWFTIHFDLRFKLILFILIWSDFDSSRITIHLICESSFWFDFESKANQSESRSLPESCLQQFYR